jgi:AcrR family transcriptional regulator
MATSWAISLYTGVCRNIALLEERVNTLSEQMRPTKARGYRKVKRADEEQRTRARIVDAAEGLHASVGPANASISAIAARAGVTRTTVYRHFPDDESLFLACSGQWLSRRTLPDPAAWATIADPEERLRAGLADLYRYFRAGHAMLANIERDAAVVPDRVRGARLAMERRWRETLLHGLPGGRRAVVRAAVGHATAFGTWRSLSFGQGLSDRAAVGLMADMVRAAGS